MHWPCEQRRPSSCAFSVSVPISGTGSRRLDVLPEIQTQFQHLKDEFEGVAEADVVSAFPLSEAQLKQLTAQLESRFKRKIKASVRIDKELIGGVRVAVGDEVLDASVRGRLAAMSSALQS